MSHRTDHSVKINEAREVADLFQQSFQITGSSMVKSLAIDVRAAADLLELHDATSLNLHNAPGLLAFVEHHLDTKVEDNLA